MSKFERKHGMCFTTEYRSWKMMKERCYNPNHKDSRHYSKRGIIVCERWKNSFLNFYQDMGAKPSRGHSLDRIDVNGNYESSNSRWATKSEQERNKQHNITVEINGEKVFLVDYAGVVGVSYETLSTRFRKGLRGEKLFAAPDPKKQRIKQPLQTVEIDGKIMSYKEAAEYKGILLATVRSRKAKGFPPELWFVPDMKYKHGKYTK